MVERVWEARASGDVMESFGWRYRVSVQRKQWTAAARRTGRAISKMETAPTREAAREICNGWDIEERQVPLFAEVPEMTEDLLLRLEREDRTKAEHIRELRECAAEPADDVENYNDCDAESRCGCHDPCCPCDGAKRGTP